MHIPDGFVSGPINIATAIVSAAALFYSLSRVKDEIAERPFVMPLLGMIAAFVFAAQMLNFPIGGGTSGHFLGAVTVAALLGPWSACVVLSTVLVLQGILFGDGGITALGTNILNMGIIAGIVMYPLMRGLRILLPSGKTGFLASVVIASWMSIILAASVCALELAFSGTSPLSLALPAMAGTHAIIGIGEALIGAAILSAVAASRPDILPAWANLKEQNPAIVAHGKKNIWKTAGAGLALALFLATFLSPYDSAFPDGLEKVAEAKGFISAASDDMVFWKNAPFPDYTVPVVERESLSTGLSGLIGTLCVFAAGFVMIRLLVRPSPQ